MSCCLDTLPYSHDQHWKTSSGLTFSFIADITPILGGLLFSPLAFIKQLNLNPFRAFTTTLLASQYSVLY